MTEIHIPPEVWEAAMSTYHKAIRKDPATAWQSAITAALAAWVECGMAKHDVVEAGYMECYPVLIIRTEAST